MASSKQTGKLLASSEAPTRTGRVNARALDRLDIGASSEESRTLPRAYGVPPTHHVIARPTLVIDRHTEADLEILGELGKGGMASVHLATQRSLRRQVAVKHATAGPTEMLLQEAITMGQLEHPNIVPVHLLGADRRGKPAIVMRRVEGVAWCALIDDPCHPAWHDFPSLRDDAILCHLEILLEVCKALSYAHSRGIVHRDVKPGNVMVGRFGEVYLLDWGVATTLGAPSCAGPQSLDTLPLGTPAYMAPEMIANDGVVDQRTDVYQLGATLHRVLTGEPRHRGRDVVRLLASIAASTPCRYGLEVPSDLAHICNRAMSRDPSDRFADVPRFSEALTRYIRHRTTRQLTVEAENRVAVLGRLTEDTSPIDADLCTIHRAFTEAHFAFTHALAECASDSRALTGLARCFDLMIRFELRRGNLDAAEGLLAQLDAPRTDLAVRLAQLRHQEAQDQAQRRELRELACSLDLAVARRQQQWFFIGLATVTLGIRLLFVSFAGWKPLLPLSPFGLTIASAMVGIVLLVTVPLGRRRLLSNTINRRVVALVALATAGVLINRVLATLQERQVADVVAADMLICTLVAATAAICVHRAFAVMVIPLLAAFVATFAWPQQSLLILAFGLGLGIGSGALLWLGNPRCPSSPPWSLEGDGSTKRRAAVPALPRS